MQPHQQRVVDEKAELDAKREKLGAFKNTDLFAKLPSWRYRTSSARAASTMQAGAAARSARHGVVQPARSATLTLFLDS